MMPMQRPVVETSDGAYISQVFNRGVRFRPDGIFERDTSIELFVFAWMTFSGRTVGIYAQASQRKFAYLNVLRPSLALQTADLLLVCKNANLWAGNALSSPVACAFEVLPDNRP